MSKVARELQRFKTVLNRLRSKKDFTDQEYLEIAAAGNIALRECERKIDPLKMPEERIVTIHANMEEMQTAVVQPAEQKQEMNIDYGILCIENLLGLVKD